MLRSDNYENLHQPEAVCIERTRTRIFMEKFYIASYIGMFAIVFPLLRLCFFVGFTVHVVYCFHSYKVENRTVELTMFRFRPVTVAHETFIHILSIITLGILVYYVLIGIMSIWKIGRFIKRNRSTICFNGRMKMPCVLYASSALAVYLLLAVILSDDTIARLITFSLTTFIAGMFEFASYVFLKRLLRLCRGTPALPPVSPLPSILRRNPGATVVDVEVGAEAENYNNNNNEPRPNGLDNDGRESNKNLNTENQASWLKEAAKRVKRVRFACDSETKGSSKRNRK